MRICPKCQFANGDEFATCVWCNRSMAGVPFSAPEDPSHPEHEKYELRKKRSHILRRQLIEAALLYSLAIAFFTLAGTGYIWDTGMLLCAFAGALLVALGVIRRLLGQLTAGLIEALFTLLTVLTFGMGSMAMFFAMAANIFAASLFCVWIDMIYDINR